MTGRPISGKDYRKVTFGRAGNWVKYAGGDARKRNINNKIPNLQKIVDQTRKQLGN